MCKDIAQTVGGKKIVWLIAIVAAVAVMATLWRGADAASVQPDTHCVTICFDGDVDDLVSLNDTATGMNSLFEAVSRKTYYTVDRIDSARPNMETSTSSNPISGTSLIDQSGTNLTTTNGNTNTKINTINVLVDPGHRNGDTVEVIDRTTNGAIDSYFDRILSSTTNNRGIFGVDTITNFDDYLSASSVLDSDPRANSTKDSSATAGATGLNPVDINAAQVASSGDGSAGMLLIGAMGLLLVVAFTTFVMTIGRRKPDNHIARRLG